MSFRTALLKRCDSWFGPLLCRTLSSVQTAPERRLLRDFPGGPVLVVRPGGIGDAVLLLPALAALRREAPGSRVDVLCETRNEELFRTSGLADRVLCYDSSPFRLRGILRRAGYAVVLDTEQFHNFSAVFAAWTRAPIRVGFKVNPLRLGIYTHAVDYDLRGAESAQFLALVAAATGRSPAAPPLCGILPRTRLPPVPEGLPRRFAVVHAGGSVPAKRWPAERFGGLCRRLREEAGLDCVLVGGAEDRRYAAEIVARAGNGPGGNSTPVDLCGRLSLSATAAVCAAADVLVGPDSGIAHLAVAAGTPAVVLFGPGDEAKWGPPAGCGTVLSAGPLPCRPCSMFGYTKPCRAPVCMESILEDEAVRAALRFVRAEFSKKTV